MKFIQWTPHEPPRDVRAGAPRHLVNVDHIIKVEPRNDWGATIYLSDKTRIEVQDEFPDISTRLLAEGSTP